MEIVLLACTVFLNPMVRNVKHAVAPYQPGFTSQVTYPAKLASSICMMKQELDAHAQLIASPESKLEDLDCTDFIEPQNVLS